MRTDRLRDLWIKVDDVLPTDRRERVKLLAAGAVSVVCLLWLCYYLFSSVRFEGRARAPDTPAWRVANEVSGKLAERPEFADVALNVESERPMKFKVVGAVHAPEDMESLKTFMKEVRPENDYELQVELLGGH